jgi:hypothetical protein
MTSEIGDHLEVGTVESRRFDCGSLLAGIVASLAGLLPVAPAAQIVHRSARHHPGKTGSLEVIQRRNGSIQVSYRSAATHNHAVGVDQLGRG